MPDRGDDAVGDQLADQVERAGQFGRDGDGADAALARVEQLAQHRRVGQQQALRSLRTAPGRGEERPFEVHAGDLACPGERGGPLQLLAHEFHRLGHQRHQGRRGATGAVERDGGRHVVGALGHVGAAAAVHVQVDESRQQPRAGQVDDVRTTPAGGEPAPGVA